MIETYAASSKLKVGSGHRFPGDLIPEAGSWSNLNTYLANGWVARAFVSSVEFVDGVGELLEREQINPAECFLLLHGAGLTDEFVIEDLSVEDLETIIGRLLVEGSEADVDTVDALTAELEARLEAQEDGGDGGEDAQTPADGGDAQTDGDGTPPDGTGEPQTDGTGTGADGTQTDPSGDPDPQTDGDTGDGGDTPFDPGDHSNAAVEAHVADVDDLDELARIRALEADGQNRVGAIAAIDGRIAALEASAGE